MLLKIFHLPMNVQEQPKIDTKCPITQCLLMKSEFQLTSEERQVAWMATKNNPREYIEYYVSDFEMLFFKNFAAASFWNP